MRRAITVAVAALSLLLFCPGQVSTAIIWEYEDCGGFKSYGERLEFKRLLKKHGLHKQVSIVYGYPESPYYLDSKGRRCTFK